MLRHVYDLLAISVFTHFHQIRAPLPVFVTIKRVRNIFVHGMGRVGVATEHVVWDQISMEFVLL
uniref:Uncharacterized protein n=1 Tax=Anguilla anguilla TaxID=7936 RepID=A0A0E9VNW8_ANGAN